MAEPTIPNKKCSTLFSELNRLNFELKEAKDNADKAAIQQKIDYVRTEMKRCGC